MKSNENFFGSFGKTAWSFYFTSNSFLNIAYGAVRSGKTIVATYRFLKFILNSSENKFLICGKSRDTIWRNVLYDFTKILDIYNIQYVYNYINGQLIFEDNIIFIIGLNDEKATDKLKGLTVAGALLDEATTVPRSSFDMLLTRCSLPDSKIFCTTNPDSPYHWLYTDYIDNSSLDEKYIKCWKFLIEDNPNLSEKYIETMKQLNSHSSAHYKRYILGEWVAAEGRIYEGFTEENIIKVNDLPDDFDRVDVGCDYGVSAPNCFLLVGVKFYEEGNKYYVLDEVYFDPERKGYSQTDSERVDDVLQLLDDYGLLNSQDRKSVIYIPHDAASLKEELYRRNKNKEGKLMFLTTTFKPNSSEGTGVIDCINIINNLCNQNKLLVCE